MPDDNDARFLITNAVIPGLTRLDVSVGKLFDKLDTVCTIQNDLKITDEIIKAKIASVELMNARTQDDIRVFKLELDKHQTDMQKHFNPYFGETIGQKLWRKKPEVAAGGTLGTFLAALLYFLLDKFGG
jgi:hypothetical protein